MQRPKTDFEGTRSANEMLPEDMNCKQQFLHQQDFKIRWSEMLNKPMGLKKDCNSVLHYRMLWCLGEKENVKPPGEASWQTGLYGQAFAPHFESLHYASATHTKKLFQAKIKQWSEISCLQAFLAWQRAQDVVGSGDSIRKPPSKFPLWRWMKKTDSAAESM